MTRRIAFVNTKSTNRRGRPQRLDGVRFTRRPLRRFKNCTEI